MNAKGLKKIAFKIEQRQNNIPGDNRTFCLSQDKAQEHDRIGIDLRQTVLHMTTYCAHGFIQVIDDVEE